MMTESEGEEEGDILCESDGVGNDSDSLQAHPTAVFLQAGSIHWILCLKDLIQSTIGFWSEFSIPPHVEHPPPHTIIKA